MEKDAIAELHKAVLNALQVGTDYDQKKATAAAVEQDKIKQQEIRRLWPYIVIRRSGELMEEGDYLGALRMLFSKNPGDD